MAHKARWESSPSRLFRREENCVQCPDEQPSCPVCTDGQMCSYITETCNQCASTKCVATNSVAGALATEAPKPAKSAAGPIAGAVIGGLVVIAIAVFLVWKFCISKRRRNEEHWPPSNMGSEKDPSVRGIDQFSVAPSKDNRGSTHTVGSLATVMSRASNFIPMVYIPGVTQHSSHSQNDLVPPVPPIPAAAGGGMSGASTPNIGHDNDDRHFFMPSDIRNSTMTARTDRNSVASTIYRNNAIVSPVPAQTVIRAKATPVSVKSKAASPNLSRSTTPPPVPSIPENSQARHLQPTLNTKSSIVGRVAQPRPVQITRKASQQHSPIYELDGSGSEASYSPYIGVPDRKFDNASPQYSHHSSTFDDNSSDEEYGSKGGANRRLMGKNRQSQATTIQDGSPISPAELPSFRNSAVPSDAGPSNAQSTSLNQMIKEAAQNASRDPLHGGLGTYGNDNPLSPFADHNAAKTP